MSRQGYRSLVVWQRARDLAIDVCRQTGQPLFRRDWALRDQLRRSAISVPSNIAEGSERGSNRDSIRFFLFARASLAELATQSEIACAIGLVPASTNENWLDECDHIARMLARLINVRR